MKDDRGIIYLSRNGALNLSIGGRILFLFAIEIIVIWVSILVFCNWDTFTRRPVGKAVVSLFIIFLVVSTSCVIIKNHYRFYKAELLKQLAFLIYLVAIFIMILEYSPDEFPSLDEGGTDNLFYLNPVNMSYVFLLVFTTSFYVLFNLYK